jgi:NADH-quinone oxidoreductase subunit C
MRSGSRNKEGTPNVLPEAFAQNQTAITINQRVPDAVVDVVAAADGPVFFIAPEQISAVCRVLRETAGFERLSAVTAVDWWPREPRFEVIYFLHSLEHNTRARLGVRLQEGAEVDSVTPIWRAANWYEREVFDLFGIPFRNHPNLERIMLPADYEGHPLRKDYPIHGHKYSYQSE